MICSSLGEFLFKLTVYRMHPRSGHIWYAVHKIVNNDCKEIYKKVSQQYDICKQSNRYYRRKKGLAIVDVLIWNELFLLTATDGHHDTFFDDQRRTGLHDFRKRSLIVNGYAVRIVQNKPSVLIEHDRWNTIHSNFIDTYWHHSDCQERFNQITPFSFWHIVNLQLQPLAKELTMKRRTAGLSPVELTLRKTIGRMGKGN